jgi:uncharacterized RDD family membrane protein YckC
VPALRRLLGGAPLGAVPLGFMGTFVTLMTYVPQCSGDEVTSRTTVSGSEVLQGRPQAFWAPSAVDQSLHAAAPWAWAVLIAALVAAVVVLVVPRYPATAAAIGGASVLVLLCGMDRQLGSGHLVHTKAEAGETAVWAGALLALLAGLSMHGWHRRPATPWARCAGFWRRAIAFAIDSLALLLAVSLVGSLADGLAGWLLLVLALAYWPAWEASRYRGTPGKQALGLVVTTADGDTVSAARAAARHAGRVLAIGTLFGAALAGWTRHGQALHDLLAGTVVVRGIDADA